MKNVILNFPSRSRLAEFITKSRLKDSDSNINECSLSAQLTDSQIVLACTKYEALLQRQEPAFLSDTSPSAVSSRENPSELFYRPLYTPGDQKDEQKGPRGRQEPR
jgi:hypothetical protein